MTRSNNEKRPVGRPRKKGELKKSVTLTLYPSVYSDIKKLAQIQGMSASELIGDILEKYIKLNGDKLALYFKVFGDDEE